MSSKSPFARACDRLTTSDLVFEFRFEIVAFCLLNFELTQIVNVDEIRR